MHAVFSQQYSLCAKLKSGFSTKLSQNVISHLKRKHVNAETICGPPFHEFFLFDKRILNGMIAKRTKSSPAAKYKFELRELL